MIPAPAAGIDELELAHARRLGGRPVLDGAIAGGVSAAILLLPALLFVSAPTMVRVASLAPLFGLTSGALLGAVVGLLDLPGRLWVMLRARDSPLALLLMSQLVGLVLSGLWTGASASLAMLPVVVADLLDHANGASIAFVVTAWFMGVALGAPTVILYMTARSLCVHYDSPPFVPAAAAIMGAAGTLTALVALATALAITGVSLDALQNLGWI